MSTFKAALPAPFVVFGIACIGFVAWLAHDAAHAPAAAHRTGKSPALVPQLDPLGGPVEARLGTLSPGQPRLSVEEQLAGLSLPQVDPVDVSGGKPVCRERYMLHLTRPVPNLTPPPEEFSPGPYTLTVEFDGGVPGHPLSRVALAPGTPHPLPLAPMP